MSMSVKNMRRGSLNIEHSNQEIVKNLNLTLIPKDLLILTGPVGCGKTTFLLSLLNETSILSGSLQIKGKVALVAADPFIISGSILTNIIFGEKYDIDKFDEVLRLCCLKKDI